MFLNTIRHNFDTFLFYRRTRRTKLEGALKVSIHRIWLVHLPVLLFQELHLLVSMIKDQIAGLWGKKSQSTTMTESGIPQRSGAIILVGQSHTRWPSSLGKHWIRICLIRISVRCRTIPAMSATRKIALRTTSLSGRQKALPAAPSFVLHAAL
jgi:hypothetical protein